MELKRLLLEELKDWALSKTKKPLLLQGARQTGKSWLMKKLGAEYFENTAYFDFAARPELSQVFDSTRDPKTILSTLRVISDQPIQAGKTLLVFDEIQLSDTAFGSLKYFAEQMPNLSIIAAGSLLGVEVRKRKIFVPVGKIEICNLYPLSFAEYLLNIEAKLFEYINSRTEITPIPEAVFQQIKRHYQIYQCIGGMPEAVAAYADGQDIAKVATILKNIITVYRFDFSQYAEPNECVRISSVWDSVPKQIAKENTRFFFSEISKHARGREYLPAIQWLVDAGLTLKINRFSVPKFPISAYMEPEIFKLYFCDLGLVTTMVNIPTQVLLEENSFFVEFKGALAENYVAQSLTRQYGHFPAYWCSGATAEVDFVITEGSLIIPIEVKSGTSITGKSLNVYRNKFKPDLAIRYSLRNLDTNQGLMNIPLPLVDWTRQLLNLI